VTPDRRKRAVRAVLVLLAICGAVLAHFAIVDRVSPAVGALLSLLPATMLAIWVARRSPHRAWILAGLAVAAVALWAEWDALERHFPSVFFLEHAGGNLFLAIVFGRSLAAGREPLCTRFALVLHETLPPEVAAYTRRITLAWTLFFAALFALSTTLYLGGFLEAWSMLATMLSPLLVALMFVAEYAVRLRVLPDWERTGVLGAFRAYSRHTAARFDTPR
jgi:uncharacterized membrane protein